MDETEVRMSDWVAQTLVRIQCSETLRFPPQGSSTEGESGPKVRLKSVVDGQQVNIPVLIIAGIEGPDSPSVDEPCGGNLRFSEHWILTNVFATQSDILTSISSIPAFASTSTYNGTLPYRYTIRISHSFGELLSPINFRRRTARPVSYYALFKGLLLLSKPPGCLSLSTTFTT